MNPSLPDLIQNPQRMAEVLTEVFPTLLAQCAALQSTLTARLMLVAKEQGDNAQQETEDRFLSLEEAAPRLALTVHWLNRHAGRLSLTVRLTRKALRFSEAGLKRWIEKQRT